MLNIRQLLAFLIVFSLSGCADEQTFAPVENRGRVAAINSDHYRVQPGDTLYSIAWASNLDYRQLATLNHLKMPYAVQAGQMLRVKLPELKTAQLAKPSTHVSESKKTLLSLEAPQQLALPNPDKEKKYPIKSSPNDSNVIYQSSDHAQLPIPGPVQLSGISVNQIKSQKQPPIYESKYAVNEKHELDKRKDLIFRKKSVHCFIWPTQGKTIGEFSTSQLGNKGIDIAGHYGQPVKACESGVVVYSGSGLRGYGNLIIIKHNVSLLSAYAHNSELNVTEGAQVQAGQEIALMGRAPSGQPMLHFEIRRDGKPVNPIQYLP
jgi:lipoprotein NlpD